MEEVIQKNETYQIIGICMEVHRTLGLVFLKLYIRMQLK